MSPIIPLVRFADGVSDAIAPRSFSGPRTTRTDFTVLRYPSPVLDWVSVTLFNSQTLMPRGIALTYRRGLRAPLGVGPSTRLSAALSVVELGPHAVKLAVELGGKFVVVVHLDTEGVGREVQHVVIGERLADLG